MKSTKQKKRQISKMKNKITSRRKMTIPWPKVKRINRYNFYSKQTTFKQNTTQ